MTPEQKELIECVAARITPEQIDKFINAMIAIQRSLATMAGVLFVIGIFFTVYVITRR